MGLAQDAVLFVTDDDIVGSIFEDWEVPEWAHNLRYPPRPADGIFIERLKEEVADRLDCPRHIRTIRTQDGWNLTQYVHTEVADRNRRHPGDEWEMYDLNASKDQLENLATKENLKNPDNKRKFAELRRKLFDLLDEKYFHPSLRTAEESAEAED